MGVLIMRMFMTELCIVMKDVMILRRGKQEGLYIMGPQVRFSRESRH